MQSAYDRVAALFRREPGMWFTREEIESSLDLTKPTACRALSELSNTMQLKTRKEGRKVFYSLPENEADKITDSLKSLSSITRKESDVLSYLLGCRYQFLDSETIKSLAEKLTEAGVINSSRNIMQTPLVATQRLKHPEWIETIKTAVEEKLKITIVYRGPYSPDSYTAEVWPIGTYVSDGALYLYSYSPMKGKCYVNAVSRIEDLSLEYDDHFVLPEGISLDDHLKDPLGVVTTEKCVTVSVRISAWQAQYELEKDWPEDTVIHRNDDGSIVMDLMIRDPYAFQRWLLGMGPEAEVIAPVDWRNWIHGMLDKMGKLYF